MVEIGGVRFPACALVCPVSTAGESRQSRTLGGYSDSDFDPGWYIHVPGENGVIVGVEEFPEEGKLGIHLHSPVCESTGDEGYGEPPLWLPILLGVNPSGNIVRYSRDKSLGWDWTTDDESWAAEHLQRVCRLPVEQFSGPRVEMVKLS